MIKSHTVNLVPKILAILLGLTGLFLQAMPRAEAQTLTMETKVVGFNPQVTEEKFLEHSVVIGVRRVQDNPKTGPDEPPQIITEAEGKFPDGEYWQYHPNGKAVQYFKPYKNGLKDGVYKEMNPDGSIKLSVTYKEGKKQGPLTMYYDNGSPQIEMPFVDNVREGVVKNFLSNGKINFEETFKRGEGIAYQKRQFEYDPDGNKRMEHFFDFTAGEGHRIYFFPEGGLKWSVQIKGDQLFDYKRYDPTGELIEQRDGPFSGDIPSYYASGELMQNDHYKNGYPAGFTMFNLKGRVLMKSL